MQRLPVAVLALLAGALALTPACTEDPDPSASDARTDGFERPGMHAIDPPPLDDRHGEVRVLVDGRLLIWGGQSAESSMTGITFGDGAVLDLGTGEWTDVADSPFPHGLYSPEAAFDGTEVVVIGTECDEQIPAPTTGILPVCTGPAAAAWDPSENRWRRLPAPPIPESRLGVPALAPTTAAAGDDGEALFVEGFAGSTITWDREGDRWGTVESPMDGWSWRCADPTAAWVVAGHDDVVHAAARYAVIRPEAPTWMPAVPSQSPIGALASCGGGQVVTSRWNGRASSGEVIDPLTGSSRPAFDVAPDRVGQATAVGDWMFVETSSAPDFRSGTTTTDPQADVEARPDGRTMSVQLLPDGRPVPAGTQSNMMTLSGPIASYVGDGIVICDLSRPDECRMWVPPAAAAPP